MKYNSAILVVLVVVMGWSCGGPVQQNQEDRTVFRYNESAGITSLDPAFARNMENIRATHLIFNGLVELDEELNVRPSIASSWEISDDGLVYTFVLRDDVYFHPSELFGKEGQRKVTAEDFVNSFLRIMDPELASPGAWIFQNLDKSQDNHLGVEALSNDSLRIYLESPFPPFLSLLSMKYCSVVPHEVVEHYGLDFRNHPIGTGPFKFQMWKEGAKLVLLRNDAYFEKDIDGLGLPYLDAVAITFVKDEEVEYLNFLKGELDYLSGTNGSNAEFMTPKGHLKAKYEGKFRVISQPYLNTEYLGFLVDEGREDLKDHPLMIREVRQAINMGFDRSSMVRYLKNNIGTPANAGFVPRGLPSFDAEKVKGYTYRPDSARKLLAKAGFPEGEGLPELQLSTTSQYLTLCEFIQGQLAEIGIRIKLDLNPAATNRELIALSKVNFFRKSWVADYPDAENYLALFYSKNFAPTGPNYTHFSNREYDDLYEQARAEVDVAKRQELYRKMDRILIHEAPVVPLYYDQVVRYVQSNVIGLGSNPMNWLDLRKVEKFDE